MAAKLLIRYVAQLCVCGDKTIFFENSRPDRKKRANKVAGVDRASQLSSSPIPPAKSYELFTPAELNHGGDRTLVFDVESYPNYFCVSFKCTVSGRVVVLEDGPQGYVINNTPVDARVFTSQLSYILHRFLVVGFNSRTYDLPICFVAIQGVRAPMLHQITDEIINNDMQAYEVERKYCDRVPHVNHVDLIEVAPLTASLKMYAGRLHCERMQDLPFPPFTHLEPWQINVVRDYNVNDLDNTQLLWEDLKPQIDLRVALGKEYQVDLRSKSDAQLAETVIVSELRKLGINSGKLQLEDEYSFNYVAPQFIRFKTPQFQQMLDFVQSIPLEISASGNPKFPQNLNTLPRGDLLSIVTKEKDGKKSFEVGVSLGACRYTVGLGGLHSSEESIAYQADADTLLIDRDVASFYPYIILNCGLFPKHLGEPFLKVYRTIVDRRLEAKRKSKEKPKHGEIGSNGGPSINEGLTPQELWGIVADSLKITINGTFGKLGNRYSKIYSPDLLIQVTMTGQLSLLMLIEMVELAAIPVVSANTDGIVIKCPTNRYTDLEAAIIIWEEQTGFLTEETRYKGLYSRDVNNYIAVKENGGCKTKGVFSEVGSALNSPLSKNPESYICSMAVQAMLEHGTPVEQTIEACRDLRKFLSVRNVKGGAEKDGVYLGKAVRWYYAKDETGTINYVLSGNKVPKSEGAKPCMILPVDFPADLDFDRYVNDANEMLYDVGFFRRAKTGTLL